MDWLGLIAALVDIAIWTGALHSGTVAPHQPR